MSIQGNITSKKMTYKLYIVHASGIEKQLQVQSFFSAGTKDKILKD